MRNRREASILPVRFLIGLVKGEMAFPRIILIIITLNCQPWNIECPNIFVLAALLKLMQPHPWVYMYLATFNSVASTKSHHLSLVPPQSTINSRRYSSFVNTAFPWNTIPLYILEDGNQKSFRHYLYNYLCAIQLVRQSRCFVLSSL